MLRWQERETDAERDVQFRNRVRRWRRFAARIAGVVRRSSQMDDASRIRCRVAKEFGVRQTANDRSIQGQAGRRLHIETNQGQPGFEQRTDHRPADLPR